MKNAALLVIDVQESFRQRPYWQDAEFVPFIARVQALIDECRRQDIPVVQIFHEESGDASQPFSAASGYVRTMRELAIAPAAVFRKSVHSAMFGRDGSGRTLEGWLRDRGVQTLLITGIRTDSAVRPRHVTRPISASTCAT